MRLGGPERAVHRGREDRAVGEDRRRSGGREGAKRRWRQLGRGRRVVEAALQREDVALQPRQQVQSRTESGVGQLGQVGVEVDHPGQEHEWPQVDLAGGRRRGRGAAGRARPAADAPRPHPGDPPLAVDLDDPVAMEDDGARVSRGQDPARGARTADDPAAPGGGSDAETRSRSAMLARACGPDRRDAPTARRRPPAKMPACSLSTSSSRGGTLVDGTGSPGRPGALAIEDDRMGVLLDPAEIAIAAANAGRVIDATGKVVAPGFIDLHSHSGLTILADPHHEPKVRQGVTTEVIGVDGNAYAPFRRPGRPRRVRRAERGPRRGPARRRRSTGTPFRATWSDSMGG